MQLNRYYLIEAYTIMLKTLKGVIDKWLKVYKLKQLRIIDISVIPIVIRGNIYLPVYTVTKKVYYLRV